ncbi:MAG: VWA domain-containing protein [Acidobacteriaceae bacterium]
MRPSKMTLAALGITGLLTFSPAYIPAQTADQSGVTVEGFPGFPSQITSAPTIKVTTRETILDVLVTDDKGQPARGLKQSDFTVSEDGHPQPIRSFAEYDKETPPAPPRTLPTGTYTNAAALPANGPVQIVYFDLPYGSSYPPGTDPAADTLQGGIFIRAQKYIAEYLRTMPAGTQVAVFAFRADYGLHLLQGFTTDGQRAATAVDNLVVLSAGKPPTADRIAAADQIAAYVAGIHGRKNLIWVGTPLAVMRDGGLSWPAGIPPPPFSSPDMTLVHRLMDTYDLFTREQIAVYPFDPKGVPVGRALGLGTLRAEEIATGTGGAAIYNTNDFKGAVAKIVNDTLHYYTLSYVPTRPDSDGHFHPISIKVDRPGLHLVYRGGYNDEQPAPPDDILKVHMTQDTMGLGALPATQLTFDVQATPSAPNPQASGSRRALPLAGKTPVTYNILYKLDQSQIVFAATPDGMRNASLEFDAAAYDPYGKLVTTLSQTQKLPLSNEEYGDFIATPFQFFQQIDLPPGQFTLRVGVFDGVSNKFGTLEIPLLVGKKSATPAIAVTK